MAEVLRPHAEAKGDEVALVDETRSRTWAELDSRVSSGSGPDCRATTDTGTVAGEQARITHHRCADREVIGRSLTHAGRGYYFTIGFPAGDATATRQLFLHPILS